MGQTVRQRKVSRLYALAFILVIGICVFVHELGHYLAGRLAGVKIYEFAIGFGPRIVSKKVGETIYAIRALPLGGLTSFAGMDDAEYEDHDNDPDDPRNFNNKSFLAKAFIVIAGPLMNFVLAILILTVLFANYGVPKVEVAEVLVNSPAEQCGLLAGDIIEAVDGKPLAGTSGFIALVSSNWDKSLQLDVVRDGEHVPLTVTPAYSETEKVGRIGAKLMEAPVKSTSSGSFVGAARYTQGIIDVTLRSFQAMFAGKAKMDVSGPIGIADMSAQAAKAGFPNLMMLVALLSVSLGIMNLMPVPILDGGWVVLLAIESLRGKPLSDEFKAGARLVGMALLLILVIYATVSDIGRLAGAM